MARIFVNRENSGWIFDKIHADYIKTTRHKIVGLNDNPDVCWFLNPWGFPQVASSLRCPAFVHVHHIDETKIEQWSFDVINKFAKGCIVPSKLTEETLKKYVDVPIYMFPYWLLSEMEAPINRSKENREILIGSFQKDSEGKTKIPKLSKGPDILLEILMKLKEKNHIFKVILTGYNRGYIIDGLEKANIPFKYFKNARDVKPLYDMLDWYFVTSRVEGGPQAVLEASYRNVKILSTDVGMALAVLHPDCICENTDEFVAKFEDGIDRVDYNHNNVATNFGCSLMVGKMDDFFESFNKWGAKPK